jgi:Trypsin-like peptidase domain
MKTKIRRLLALVLLSGAVTTLLVLGKTLANTNPQTEPEVSVPSIASTGTDNAGMHTRANIVLPSARYGSHIDVNQPSVVLGSLDIRSVTIDAPNQIGINRSVAVSAKTQPQKFVNSDGSQIIVLVIRSSGASGIGLHFRNFNLSPGEEVYVYSPAADSIVCGPYADKGPWGNGEFWSATIAGDTAVIELFTKAGEDGKSFEIFEISHIFPELGGPLMLEQPNVGPLPCERDASCYSDAERNAVARILFNDNGARVCTGTLINDCAQDRVPYFLTANHCISTQTVAQTVEAYWFYQTTTCNGGVLRSWVHSPPGANLLATQRSNDFSLLRLQNNPPAGAVFSGWTSVAQPTGTAVFSLHHPEGYIPPSVPSYLRRATGSITSTNVSCADSGLASGYRSDWTSGTTEPGASGAGLWNSSHSFVGVLSCGPAPPTCSSPDAVYSKFANFYPQIRPYICSSTPTSYLGNISTRSFVQTGENVMIGGFIVEGTGPKRVIIRAIGPELTQYGITNALANPTLELHNRTGALIGSNDDWQTTILGGVITANQVSEIQNSGHAPTAASESAIIANLQPGNYTAIVRGINNTNGVALVEVYDLNPAASSSLGNISTRSFVQTGENVMIGGFIVEGIGPKRVIIRAIGPELTQHGITNALANPRLELHNRTGALIGSNDNWQTTILGGIITTNQVSEIQNSGRAPAAASESAIIANLQPGNYTAIIRGVNNTAGVALVDVYDLN